MRQPTGTVDRLMKLSEVAELFQVSERTVLRYWKQAALPGYRLANGRGALRFRPEEVYEWLGRHRSVKRRL